MKRRLAFLCLLLVLIATPLMAMGSSEKGSTVDRAGNKVSLPSKTERIAVFAPSIMQVVDGLGLTDKVIAVDTNSLAKIASAKGLPAVDMMRPDTEKIIAMNPDIVFTSGMSNSKGDDPFKPIRDAGICVFCIPSSSSLTAIYEDITVIATILGEKKRGVEMIATMKKDLAKLEAIGKSIPKDKRKTVYFEISAAPYIYTSGGNTFINESIALIGAENVFGSEQNPWLSISEEQVIAKNPDVIITQVHYIPNAVNEIKSRSAWKSITAIKNGAVYQVDEDLLAQPCQHVVKGIEELAKFVYPEYFK